MELCNIYMIELQCKQLLVAQQKEVLERLRERLMNLGHVQNSITFVDTVDVAQTGGFSMSNQSAKLFVLNLGDLDIISTYQTLEQQDPDTFEAMNTNIVQMFIRLVHGLFILSPERDSSNNATTQFPSCQPYSIVNMGSFEFSNIVCERRMLSLRKMVITPTRGKLFFRRPSISPFPHGGSLYQH